MWRVKRLADPDGVLGPGVVMNDDPGVHLQNLKTTPEVEEVVNTLRRVRLLRARLPQPGPDHDAPPADRAAARDGAPGRGLAGREGARAGVRVRRPRDLRGRRDLRARLPALDRHRQAGEGAAHAAHSRAARSRRGAGREELAVGRAPLARRPARRAPRGARRRRLPAAAGAAAPRDEPRGRRGRLLPLLHEPDHGRVEGGGPRPGPARRARRRLGAGGHAGLDPARRRRQLLRRAVVSSKGHREAHAWMARGRSRSSGAGATAARCRS